MSDKDEADLRWALQLRADMIALSFVRSAGDIDDVRRIMDEEGVRLPVIAKIEKPQAVANLEEIVRAFDGLMVARGDLGVELPLEQVPLVQKRAVELARRNAKPVIVATQMLDSMIYDAAARPAPRPRTAPTPSSTARTRVMLSGETSVGQVPARVGRDDGPDHREHRGARAWSASPPLGSRPSTKGGVITAAPRRVAEFLDVKYLVAFTQSGDSARRMARLRSRIPLLAFTPEAAVRSQLALTWGIETFLTPYVSHTDEMVAQVDERCSTLGRCVRGDEVVIVAGSPARDPGLDERGAGAPDRRRHRAERPGVRRRGHRADVWRRTARVPRVRSRTHTGRRL